MDPDDARRRMLQLNPTIQQPPGYQGQRQVYRLNASSGELEAYEVVGRGVDVFLEHPNVIPRPQPPNLEAINNFGTPRSPLFVPATPIAESGSGVDGLKEDPNIMPKPDGDRKGARGPGPALFPG